MIDGFINDWYPWLSGARERILVLKDIDLPGAAINVPYAKNDQPGQVTLIMPFLKNRIAGRFVFHCHILEHEDGGMMANINVLARGDAQLYE